MKNNSAERSCKKWEIFELAVEGPQEGNPFLEQSVYATFRNENETVTCEGFYDGEGIYRVRFMPSFEGRYSYCLESSFGLREEGAFVVTSANEYNHGPVRVALDYPLQCAENRFIQELGTGRRTSWPLWETCRHG